MTWPSPVASATGAYRTDNMQVQFESDDQQQQHGYFSENVGKHAYSVAVLAGHTKTQQLLGTHHRVDHQAATQNQ